MICPGTGRPPEAIDLDRRGRAVCADCHRTYRCTWNSTIPRHEKRTA